MSEKKLFAKYVSQNILGMLGISVYILADTFFISMAEGADGITALNLVLPVYSLIFAVGAMIGVGIGDPVQDPQGAGRPERRYVFFQCGAVGADTRCGLHRGRDRGAGQDRGASWR